MEVVPKPRAWNRVSPLLGRALLGAALLAARAAAQAPAPPPRVVAVAVEPPPGRSAASYQALVRQQPGQPLAPEAVAASLRALFATGEFRDVEAVRYPAPGGVRLLFATQPNAFIAEVRVEGSPDPPASTELEDASGLTLGDVYTRAGLAQAVARINQRLRSYGYYQAAVLPQAAVDRRTGLARLGFAVTAGPLARLGQVRFTGTLLAPEARLRRAIGLKPDQPLTRERLDDAVAALQNFYTKLGRLTAAVALANPTYRPARNQLDIHFEIAPGPLVTVATEGMRLSAGTLRQQVPIYEEHAADLALVEEGRSNLVNYLQGQGYFEAQVDDRRLQPHPGLLQILYLIQPGPKESLDAIQFAGNRYFDADDLAERIALRTTSPWPSFVPGARGRFSTTLAQGDAAAIAALYQRNGFAEVRVEPAIDRAYRGQAHHIAVVFRIHEGPQTLVRRLRIVGASPANQAAIAAQLTTAPGQPFAEASLAQDRNAILTYYYNAGYQGATCNATAAAVDPDPPAPPVEDVTFTVHEGAVQTVHQVFIAGNHFVHRNVIAHALQLHPGQPLSQSALLQTQRSLYDSGLFTSASVVASDPSGAERSKDILVSVNEARRYTFSEGIGLQVQGGTGGSPDLRDILGQTGYSPLFSFDATRTAMTGRAQTLSFRSSYGTLQKRAVLGYDLPNFLNHSALRADLTTFYDDTFDIRTFRAVREQAGFQLEQTLGPGVGWTYNFDYRRVRVISPLVAPQEIPILSQPVQVAELAANYRRDRRDDPLDTHRGSYNSVQFALAKSYGDGFANFARIDLQNHWYHPLNADGTVILARSTQIGVELPFGPRSLISFTNPVSGATSASLQYVVPLPERYLSGGSDSLRGFAINQAGPRDPITAFPVGGEAMLVNNLELRFPLIGPNIGGVVFYDLGNVYSTPRQMVRSLFRWRPPSATDNDFTSHTVGLGLRYRTPVGPVRLDTGYLLNAPTFQYFSSGAQPAVLLQRLPPFHFFFSIGQTF